MAGTEQSLFLGLINTNFQSNNSFLRILPDVLFILRSFCSSRQEQNLPSPVWASRISLHSLFWWFFPCPWILSFQTCANHYLDNFLRGPLWISLEASLCAVTSPISCFLNSLHLGLFKLWSLSPQFIKTVRLCLSSHYVLCSLETTSRELDNCGLHSLVSFLPVTTFLHRQVSNVQKLFALLSTFLGDYGGRVNSIPVSSSWVRSKSPAYNFPMVFMYIFISLSLSQILFFQNWIWHRTPKSTPDSHRASQCGLWGGLKMPTPPSPRPYSDPQGTSREACQWTLLASRINFIPISLIFGDFHYMSLPTPSSPLYCAHPQVVAPHVMLQSM